MTNREFLGSKLATGPVVIGQIIIRPGYSLTHGDDDGAEGLTVARDPHEAIALARYDAAGAYRPLKTAPNLRRGWQLILPDMESVGLALDFFYPAAVGLARAMSAGSLAGVSMRETLDRQSGMYAITKKLTTDQGVALRDGFCRTGCLRVILWPIEPGQPAPDRPPGGPEIPLLCAECCNLFVAEARKVVKKAQAAN